ncbi:MAG: hypothetical protein HQK50_02425 [Oligoflexia bacterium]|nr:hypothetical protein [Oligoflexia bacterium]MBF0364395.1 hypothetical protein [Oligoflexia bacterium]
MTKSSAQKTSRHHCKCQGHQQASHTPNESINAFNKDPKHCSHCQCHNNHHTHAESHKQKNFEEIRRDKQMIELYKKKINDQLVPENLSMLKRAAMIVEKMLHSKEKGNKK